MFCIFNNDLLINFWANQIGDIFIDATIRGLKLTQSLVDLNYYPELYSVPAFYEFDQDKKLIIKKEVVTINEVITQNEAGDDVTTQEEVKSYVTDKVIEPIVYMSKGILIKQC
jgi:hypothetical protein